MKCRWFIAVVLLSGFFLMAGEGGIVQSMWVSPSSPPGSWSCSGEAFPAEKVAEAAAAAGATDIEFCIDNSHGVPFYDSKVTSMKRDKTLPPDTLDRMFAAAEKHHLRCWLVLTPSPQSMLADGTKVMTTSDPRAVDYWRARVAELGELYRKRYPKSVVGIVLHEFNRPEASNPHAGELKEFSAFCQKNFGEAFPGTKMPDGRDGSLWNRRFNLFRIECLTRLSRAMRDEAAKYGMKTSFILYSPEMHRSFAATWGYDTRLYEKMCDQIWSAEYPTLKGMYTRVAISYRGVNVAQSVVRSFHEYPKGFFEMRAPFFPEIVREFYKKNVKFTATHGDFFTGYSGKSPAVMELFFGKERVTRWVRESLRWYGAEPLTHIGVIGSSIPHLLRHPVNPGADFERCVGSVFNGVTARYPAIKLLAGSELMLDPVALRKRFDVLILPEEQGMGLDRETVDALKKYIELGGRLIGIATPVTIARCDLTEEKDVTAELFGVTVSRGKNAKVAHVSGTPREGTAFFPVSYSQASEKEFYEVLDRMLRKKPVFLTENQGFLIHNACVKDDVICIALPADAPSKAVLHCTLPAGDYEVRNLLTGEIVATGNAELLARGVKIETLYNSEPYVLGVGPKAKMAAFPGIYPSREVFAELEKFPHPGIQNPEVPLLIPGKPGLKVGIYMSGTGAENILKALVDENGINAFLIPRLDEPCIKGSDVVIVPKPFSSFYYREGVPALKRAIASGKGVIICHSALDTGHKDFREIFLVKPVKHTKLSNAQLTTAEGSTFIPGFAYDHYDCVFTDGVKVLASSAEGKPVIGVGSIGKGKLAVFGVLLGHFGKDSKGTEKGKIAGGEKEMLLQVIQSIRGDK